MKLRIIASLAVLSLAVSLVIAGITTAWFTSKDSPPAATAFLMGILNIEITGEEVDSDEFRWEISSEGDCREFTWTIANTGTKGAYLRARLVETVRGEETAWGEGTRFVEEPGNWAMYFPYQVGSQGSNNSLTVDLLAGQHQLAGTVKVWNDNDHLYVQYSTEEAGDEETGDEDGWQIAQLHLAVADDLLLIPTTPSGKNQGNPIPGRFPFQESFDELVSSTTFEIDLQGTYPEGALKGLAYDWIDDEPATLYIAAHADLIGTETSPAAGLVEWSQQEDCSHQWEEHGGYWYYCPDPPVAPGEEVTLCLTGCPLETGLYQVKLSAEAVQAHPEAVALYWGEDVPCLQE